MNEFDGYEAGWRRGAFDALNFRECIDVSDFEVTPYNTGFAEGYADAYAEFSRAANDNQPEGSPAFDATWIGNTH